MKPFEPEDPVWKLLGKGRKVETRTQFLQNVVREARNTPQERGGWARVRAWWEELVGVMPVGRLVGAAVVVVILGVIGVGVLPEDRVEVALAEVVVEGAVEAPLVPEVETQLESLDYLDELLAMEDTSGLSDREVAYFLY